ncbi:clarin-3 [Salarias fasciatus]|uniref:Clarin-3-like n=1 Tax=Salarias fasciatus TaxID=181472 RepID=A0A672JP29_SALFA|nr:clarin-3-like [Salarias fasciatus]
MPSSKKILHFTASALLTSVAVGLLGFGMSAQWAISNSSCGGTILVNGTAKIELALFEGKLERVDCPLFGSTDYFSVVPTLIDIGGASSALHILVVFLLVLSLLFSAGNILISLYNSVANPYETYMGPIGVYTCCSVSVCLAALALILFVVNISVTGMADSLVEKFSSSEVTLKDLSSEMQVGFFMIIPNIALNLGAIGSIYMYDHAAYTHRREQQKPTEDAPKEIMMY